MINVNNKSVFVNSEEKSLNSKESNLKVQSIQCITLTGNQDKIHFKESLTKKEILKNLFEKDEKVSHI